MPDTTFSAGTVITSSWLNEVNEAIYGIINVKRDTYGAVGDGITDDTTAIQNAITAATTALATVSDPYSAAKFGRGAIYLPAGRYKISATLSVPNGVTFYGDGKHSSIIEPTQNDSVIEVAPTVPGVYGATGVHLHDFGIYGDRTKTSQTALALLRPCDSTFNDIYIQNCGGDGIVVYEGLANYFENVIVYLCVGAGCYVRDGIESFTDSTPTNYPSNNNTFMQCHFAFNDGPGVKLGGTGTSTLGFANNNKFIQCPIEYNYRNSSAGTGNNVEDYSNSYFGNTFESCWFESPASGTGATQYHIYKESVDVSAVLYLNATKHAAGGAAAYPERYVRVVVGSVIDTNSQGTGNLYRTVAGSNAPIRVTKATARADVTDPTGSLVTDGKWVEDETGATTGLYNNARIDVFGALYGPANHRADSTDVGFQQYRTGDANAFISFNAGSRTLDMGDGTTLVAALINNRVGISDDRGDANVTLTAGTDYSTQRFATTLTANRVVTLSTTGAVRGHKFRVSRTGLGAFTLDVGGLKAIASGTAGWVDVEFDGTAWRLTGYGTL